MNKKRVVQYSVDIMIDNDNNVDLEKLIENVLRLDNIDVLGVMFSDDLTEEYKKCGWLD